MAKQQKKYLAVNNNVAVLAQKWRILYKCLESVFSISVPYIPLNIVGVWNNINNEQKLNFIIQNLQK